MVDLSEEELMKTTGYEQVTVHIRQHHNTHKIPNTKTRNKTPLKPHTKEDNK